MRGREGGGFRRGGGGGMTIWPAEGGGDNLVGGRDARLGARGVLLWRDSWRG